MSTAPVLSATTPSNNGRPRSVFADADEVVYPYRYRGTIHVFNLAGGDPGDPRKAEAWIRSKFEAGDERIEKYLAQHLEAHGLDPRDEAAWEEAIKAAAGKNNSTIFPRDRETGELYLKGYQLFACIKEAAMVRWAAKSFTWGPTKKGTKGFVPEHLFVIEDRLPLGVFEPTREDTRFVHSFRGNGIHVPEVVEDAQFTFHLKSDIDFERELKGFWAALWKTAEELGIGATRSQGYGRFVLTQWDRV